VTQSSLNSFSTQTSPSINKTPTQPRVTQFSAEVQTSPQFGSPYTLDDVLKKQYCDSFSKKEEKALI
jgi:hypothetical protein